MLDLLKIIVEEIITQSELAEKIIRIEYDSGRFSSVELIKITAITSPQKERK